MVTEEPLGDDAGPQDASGGMTPEDAARLGVLAEKLREHRDLRALTQEQFAQSAGLSRSMIANVERGAYLPKKRARRRLAAALGVPVEDLFEPPRNREG